MTGSALAHWTDAGGGRTSGPPAIRTRAVSDVDGSRFGSGGILVRARSTVSDGNGGAAAAVGDPAERSVRRAARVRRGANRGAASGTRGADRSPWRLVRLRRDRGAQPAYQRSLEH